MPREFFRRAAAGTTSPSGTLVSDIQAALNGAGIGQIGVDGLFGGQTEGALRAFQVRRGLPQTGTVSDATWQTLMRTDAPPLFERCLQVTASFEGTHFTEVVGNFDGAGLTWGIIGFTLSHGELGAILDTINLRLPGAIGSAFGDDADDIMRIVHAPMAERIAWADSISRGPQKYAVADPWKTYFRDLGSLRDVQRLQVDRAREVYWGIAQRDARALGLKEELDHLLLFDVAVQNGGMQSKGRHADALAGFAAKPDADPAAKRHIVAHVVANSASPTYQGDVRSRKLTIAEGAGTVHGGKYVLADWGFLDGQAV
jgi:hypothetical protein